MKIKLNKWIILFLIVTANALPGQSSLIEVEAAVDKSVITIGDRVTYTLKINREKGLQVKEPGKGTNLGMFEIKDYFIHDSLEAGSRVMQQFDYVLSVYDTGQFVIPPYPIAFLPTDTSSRYQFITSEPLKIYVESVVNDENAEIHDIRPPLGIPVEYWRMILMIGSLVLGLAALAIAYWLYKKRKEGRPIFRKETIRPAHEIALEELQRLVGSNLLAEGQHKIFYTELSDIVRRYIERRFFIQAMEETTSELLASLKEAEISPGHISLVKEILDGCDLVKFAKYIPEEAETESTVQSVREFIEQTRLEFEAVETETEEPVEMRNGIEN